MTLPKSTHLILLLGSNPIPNAVAALLLAAPEVRITLIDTNRLGELTGRFESWLKTQDICPDCIYRQGPVDESSEAEIKKAVTNALDDAQQANQNGHIGLHYTGGTKAMAVHAYRAAEHWTAENQLPQPACSYLDARKLELIFDVGGQGINAGEERHRLVDKPRINLKDMLDLHGLEEKKKPKGTPLLPGTAQVLLQVHQDQQSLEAWNDWLIWTFIPSTHTHKPVNRTIWVLEENDWRICRKAEEVKTLMKRPLQNVSVPWPDAKCLADVVASLKQDFKLDEALNFANIGLADSLGEALPKNRCRRFTKWLLGEWLESAVLMELNQCKDKGLFDECALDLEAKLQTRQQGINPDFQLDVLAIRGYRLFAFSCTTDTSKSTIKLKLFEAYMRARQLGGDEARVAIIACCNASEAQIIEAEILRDLDVTGGKTRVFGRDCLCNLAVHIESWVGDL